MAIATSRSRRRLSKRQKRRSLKRKNAKSRKVMRGGRFGDDPLLGVKEGDTVTVAVTEYPRHPDPKPIDKTLDCNVMNVQDSNQEYSVPKIVTLKLPPDSKIEFSKVINTPNYKTEPTEYSDTFDIILNKDGKSYSFRTYSESLPNTYTQTFMKPTEGVVPGVQRWIASVSIKPTPTTE